VHKKNKVDWLWDAWCIFSVIGIWPRFIEPHLVKTSHLELAIDNLPSALEGLKIVQITDLHLNRTVPNFFLKKIVRKINALKPDLLFFTGDFICQSLVDDPARMEHFFNQLETRYGCYATLGNHDYEECLSINSTGDYDVIDTQKSSLLRGFKRLFSEVEVTGNLSERAAKVDIHPQLLSVLGRTSLKILHNETRQIAINGSVLNVCGLGEYMAGRCLPELAFQKYDAKYPGIVLSHNPDTIAMLKSFPGEVVLCGHTHGCQVNLPWMWKKFTKLENMTLRKGLFQIHNKWMYINRGLGSVMKFRWFAPPEILHLTLRKKS
jgi:hypothetical protein